MNAILRNSGDPDPQPIGQPPPRSRRLRRLLVFGALWSVLVLIALVAVTAWIAGTPAFQNRVRRAVVAELQKSTGGRVDLKRFTWRLTHLEFEVDDLTIHGLEAPDQVPYAHIDRLFVRLQVLSFFRPRIGLNYLEADHPVVHLIVYPDGSTNQPRPKHPSSGNSVNEIFSLAIERTVVDNGVAILNQRATPFNLTANNLAAQLTWVPARDRYVGTLHAEDVIAQRGADLPVHSIVDASVDLGRNSATLVSLSLQSGPQGKSQKTVLRASGALENFADPRWQFTAKGAIDASETRAFASVPGPTGGLAQIEASGHGSKAQFIVDGNARIVGGAYRIGTVNATGITADAIAHITEDRIAVTAIHARLATGGFLTGAMHIDHWQAPPSAPNSQRQQGTISTQLAGFTLDSLLDTVAPRNFRRLGFATSAAGTANVDWTGSLANLTGAVNVTLTPPATIGPGEVPVTGAVAAEYVNRLGTVLVRDVDVHTPASEIHASGSLGVYPLTRRTAIDASLVTCDVADFNPALAAS